MKTSSYNLVMSAMYNGRKGDRPPVGNPTSIVCHGLMDTAEVSFPDAHLDAKMAVEKVGTLMSLVGNVNNPQVLYQGTLEDVNQQVRYAVEAGINIIGPECAIPLSTPVENLKAIVEAAHEGY